MAALIVVGIMGFFLVVMFAGTGSGYPEPINWNRVALVLHGIWLTFVFPILVLNRIY